MVKRYKVTVHYTTKVELNICASSQEKAEEFARIQASKNPYNEQIIENCEFAYADSEEIPPEEKQKKIVLREEQEQEKRQPFHQEEEEEEQEQKKEQKHRITI